MKHHLFSTSIAALATIFAISAPANAADVYTPGSAYQGEDSAPAREDWSGPYVGAAVGYGAANYELSVPGFGGFDGISGRGFQGCGIAGVQQQAGTFVFGAEGRGCLGEVSTDLRIGPNEASLELDHSYSLYAKAGIAHGSVLTSVLAGYRWQHYEISAPGFSFDDTVGGLSGGVMIEKRLAGNWNVGLETMFTQFEEQDAAILNIDPTLFEGNIRLTYTFGR